MTSTDQPSRRLRDVVTLEKGKPPTQQPFFGAGAERYLTPDYLRGGGAVELVKPSVNAVHVSDGDTIVLWDGSNAGEVMRGRAGVLASTMTRVSHGSGFNKGYFFYALKRWESLLKGQTSGSGIPHVDKEILGNLDIIEFDPPEQIRIAEILSTVDRASEQTEALIAKQQRIKTGLMQGLLTRGIDEYGNLRSEQTHEFRDSPLGRIPVEWGVKTLQAITDEDITYGIVQAGAHVENGIPYIRTGDMAGDSIDENQLLRTSSAIARSYQRSTIFSGDIVFALRATVGKVLPVTPSLDGANLTQGTAKISPNSATDATFLLWAIRSSSVQSRIRLQQKGTTFMEITLGDLRLIELALPLHKEEQVRIAAVLIAHEKSLLVQKHSLEKLRSLKNGLMHDLLSGRRRVIALLSQPVGATA